MTLLKRIMWPNKGEEIEVYRNGTLLVEGHVTHADDSVISIMGQKLNMYNISAAELLRGIEDRTIVVKKKKIQ
jgi:hypothetical protein